MTKLNLLLLSTLFATALPVLAVQLFPAVLGKQFATGVLSILERFA